MEKTFSVTLTDEEGAVLLQLIDSAVRMEGMRVAKNAVILTEKLVNARRSGNSAPPLEIKE